MLNQVLFRVDKLAKESILKSDGEVHPTHTISKIRMKQLFRTPETSQPMKLMKDKQFKLPASEKQSVSLSGTGNKYVDLQS